MEPTAMDESADTALVDEALAVVADARGKAPREFLRALTGILGSLALGLVAGAALTNGTLHDLLLNLAAEVIGALLTVVLIDGLWKRMEAGTSASLQNMNTELASRRTSPMTQDERLAWRVFVHEYTQLQAARSPLDRARSVVLYRRHLQELEERGNRTLARFGPNQT
jgi:hypothetical protein